MDERLKQRLVGASVLVALAVIIVPMLLDGAGRKARDPATFEIPPQPELSQRPLQKLEDIVPVPTPAQALVGHDGEGEAAETATPHAWAVQVGAFSSEANAIVLRDKLRSKGHPAFVEASGDKSQFRVRIGPEASKSLADELRDTLAAEYGHPGIVVRYP